MEVGKKVEHILSKDWLLVIEVGSGKVKCRTKDLREVWLFNWEVHEVK